MKKETANSYSSELLYAARSAKVSLAGSDEKAADYGPKVHQLSLVYLESLLDVIQAMSDDLRGKA